MNRRLKTERLILILIIILSLFTHLIFGIEGAEQVKAYENEIFLLEMEISSVTRTNILWEYLLFSPRPDYEAEAKSKETHLGEFEITYYCPCTKCCGKTDGITASGTLAIEGQTVAADWDLLPPGTRIYIEGIGFRTVEDKGGAINGNKLDVYMDSHAAALEAGRHKADVWIVEDEGE